MNRRSFIRKTAGAAAVAAATPSILGGMPLYAKSPLNLIPTISQENDNILIIIQLFGGNDGLNTIVPVENPIYYQLRPNLAVPKAIAKQYSTSNMYFHPSLVNGVLNNGFSGLIDSGRLAVVRNIGYENPNLSHFRSTDIWLSGMNPSSTSTPLLDGWIGRYFAKRLPDFPAVIPPDPLCIQLGGAISLLLESPKGEMGIALSDPNAFFQLGQGLSPDEAAMTDGTAFADEFNFIRSVAQQSDTYSKVVKQAYDKGKNKTTYASGFPQQMAMIAKLISGGLKTKVYLVYLGGFDTHVQQQLIDANGATGLHPNLLNTVATGISQFMDDALQQGFADRVVGMTVSEFGRRPAENGSNGTDHGAASNQFVFGTSVNAGVFGNAPDLANLNANGDVVYENDYRRIYADVMENWFGAPQDDVDAVLGTKGILPRGVIRYTADVNNPLVNASENPMEVFPNPSTGNASVSFELKSAASVAIEIFSARGTFVATVFKGDLDAGYQNIPINLNNSLVSGEYFCVLNTGGKRYPKELTILK